MVVAVWPSELPRPERNTWRKTPMEARLKRSGESGPPAYRLRFSGVPKFVSLSIVVNRAVKAVFEEFYEETTAYGSRPFYMPDPTTDGWAATTAGGSPILDGSGNPVLLSGQWLCLFGDDLPVETIEGVNFRYTFSVVVMP